MINHRPSTYQSREPVQTNRATSQYRASSSQMLISKLVIDINGLIHVFMNRRMTIVDYNSAIA